MKTPADTQKKSQAPDSDVVKRSKREKKRNSHGSSNSLLVHPIVQHETNAQHASPMSPGVTHETSILASEISPAADTRMLETADFVSKGKEKEKKKKKKKRKHKRDQEIGADDDGKDRASKGVSHDNREVNDVESSAKDTNDVRNNVLGNASNGDDVQSGEGKQKKKRKRKHDGTNVRTVTVNDGAAKQASCENQGINGIDRPVPVSSFEGDAQSGQGKRRKRKRKRDWATPEVNTVDDTATKKVSPKDGGVIESGSLVGNASREGTSDGMDNCTGDAEGEQKCEIAVDVGNDVNNSTSKKASHGKAGANNADETDEDKERTERTIFVGNVSHEVKRKELAKLFSEFGSVESVRLRNIIPENPQLPRKVALLTSKIAKFSKENSAYVVFKKTEDVDEVVEKACVEKNMTLLKGKNIRVMRADVKRSGSRRLSVFVGNLAFDCGEQELIEAFLPVAKENGVALVGVRLNRDTDTGAGRGVGFVTFDDDVGVQACLNLTGKMRVGGRLVRMERAQKEKKMNSSSYRMKRKMVHGNRQYLPQLIEKHKWTNAQRRQRGKGMPKVWKRNK